MELKTVCVLFHHLYHQHEFGRSDGGIDYGHRYLSFSLELIERMKRIGFDLKSGDDCDPKTADAVVFWDLNPELLELQKTLGEIPCILMTTESPLYCPLTHDPEIALSSRWSSVLTWNRTIQGEKVLHHYLPSNSISDYDTLPVRTPEFGRPGVVVKSGVLDLGRQKLGEIAFIVQLAKYGLVDVYGKHWPVWDTYHLMGPTPDKMKTMAAYDFTFISENCTVPGFLSEKIGDAVLAGIPSIYYGDWVGAEEKFPGCSVPMKEFSMDAFLQARTDLYNRYGEIQANIARSFENRSHWNEKFFQDFEVALKRAVKCEL